jgi:hypothetical protein
MYEWWCGIVWRGVICGRMDGCCIGVGGGGGWERIGQEEQKTELRASIASLAQSNQAVRNCVYHNTISPACSAHAHEQWHARTLVHISIDTHADTHARTHTYAHTNTHTHAHTHTHTQTPTRTHAHTHTRHAPATLQPDATWRGGSWALRKQSRSPEPAADGSSLG